MYFDTHCHLNDKSFKKDRKKIIKKAKEKNISKMIVVGWNIKSSKKAIKIAKKHKNIYASVGIHPSNVKKSKRKDLLKLKKLLKNKKVVALGEIGLDYHWDKDNKKNQKHFFVEQIKIAKEFKKPIIIHTRDAVVDTYKIIKENKKNIYKCVMHCFSYSYEEAKNYLDLGFFISLGGPLTFKNGKKAREIVEKININKLLIETDSPYLTPHPYRGKRNDPSYLPFIEKEVSKIKKTNCKEILFNNSVSFFEV